MRFLDGWMQDEHGGAAQEVYGSMPPSMPPTMGLSMGSPQFAAALPAQALAQGSFPQFQRLPSNAFKSQTQQVFAGGGSGGNANRQDMGGPRDVTTWNVNPEVFGEQGQGEFGAYQSKWNKVEDLGDGRFAATLQDPGKDKYSQMRVVYAQDPATGEYVAQGDPTRFRQQSSNTEYGQALGTAAAWVAAPYLGPAISAAAGGGIAGGAAAGATLGGGSALASGSDGDAALRGAVMGGIGGGISAGLQGQGWTGSPAGVDPMADYLNTGAVEGSTFGGGGGGAGAVGSGSAAAGLQMAAPGGQQLTPAAIDSMYNTPGYGANAAADAVVGAGNSGLDALMGFDSIAGPVSTTPSQSITVNGSAPPGATAGGGPGLVEAGAGGGLLSAGGDGAGPSGGGADPYRPSQNYGEGMSGNQTGTYDGIIDATGSPGLANAGANVAGGVDALGELSGPALSWLRQNPQLARLLVASAGGLLGATQGDGGSGGGGGNTFTGEPMQWTGGLQMGIQPGAQQWQPSINNPAAVQPRQAFGAGRFFNGG